MEASEPSALVHVSCAFQGKPLYFMKKPVSLKANEVIRLVQWLWGHSRERVCSESDSMGVASCATTEKESKATKRLKSQQLDVAALQPLDLYPIRAKAMPKRINLV